MGIAASQAGEDEAAISYWEMLLQQLEPGRTITKSVQDQIALAQTRLGLNAETETETETAPAAATEPATEINTSLTDEQPAGDAGWPGISIRVSPSDALRAEIPPGAVLYVMLRTPGPAAGPPIGVRRIRSPALPLEITINDSDSMLEERMISSQPEVQLQARLSLSGAPRAQSGDWQSSTQVIPLNSTNRVELVIDQQVE
jgi:cytochrome c-type biogenesis protein CcmH